MKAKKLFPDLSFRRLIRPAVPVDNLESTDVDRPLSANMGREVKEQLTSLDNKITELDKNCLNGTVKTIHNNIYVSESNEWVYIDTEDISKYRFLNFSFSDPDNAIDQSVLRNVISYNTFKQSTATIPIEIVLNPWNSSNEYKVRTYYVSDTQIAIYRGSNCYQYYRFNIHGIN